MVQHQRERKTKLFGKKFYQKDNSNIRAKAQSAMEYLMTYGWAILIIAVVLAALDFLGVFNGNTFVGSSCLATPGYLCSNPVMTANANGPNLLSFNFEQDTGQTLYNVEFACAATSDLSGFPNVAAGTVNYGFEKSLSLRTISSGSSVSVSGLQCYGSNGGIFQDNPIGTVFAGTIWINYTLQESSTPQYAKIAKMIAKVSSSASGILLGTPYVTLSPLSNSIFTSQNQILSVSVSDLYGPFIYNYFEKAPGSSTFTKVISVQNSLTTNSYSFATTSSSTEGNYSFYANVSNSTITGIKTNNASIYVMPQYVAYFSGGYNSIVATSINLNGLPQITVSFWIKPVGTALTSQGGNNPSATVVASDGVCPDGMVIQYNPPTATPSNIINPILALYPQDSSNNCLANGYPTFPISPNKWSFIAYTFNGVEATLYENTYSTSNQVVLSPNTIYANPGFYIGWSNANRANLIAYISNVQLYGNALSSNQISYLYNEGIGGIPVSNSNIIAQYSLNNNVNDLSGNGHTATPYNAVFTSNWIVNYTNP